MRRPNAIVHMTFGGLLAGALCGALYGIALLFGMMLLDSYGGYSSGWLSDILGLFMMGGFFGAMFGAPLGLGLGFLSGFALDWQVRRLDYPITPDAVVVLRRQVRTIVFIIAGLGAVLGLGWTFNDGSLINGSLDPFFVLLPAVISVFAALRVANRYITRLEKWGASKRKEKAAV